MKRWWKFLALPAAGLYGGFLAATYVAMRMPPESFAHYMKRLPPAAMTVLPFRPLWMAARGGSLTTGDAAPDFEAATVDKRERIRFREFRQGRPVVLVFGSYT